MTANVIGGFFHPQPFEHAVFPNSQAFDFAGLRGRLLSSSYAPPASHPAHGPMLAELAVLFDAHQYAGRVTFDYETHVYGGRLLTTADAGRA